MVVACGIWLSVQVLWTYFEVYLRRDTPNPFVGDIALFLHLVPMMAALAVRPDIERSPQPARVGSLDFVLLFFWWLYLYLFVVIPWEYVSVNPTTYGRNFDILYFTEHLVLLIGAAIAWHRSQGTWRAIYRQFFLASLLYAITSVAAGVAIDYGAYYTGSFYDLPLLASVVLFNRAAFLGRESTRPSAPPKLARAGHNWISNLAIAAAATMPLLAAWAVFFSNAPNNVRSFRLVLTLAAIVVIGALRSRRQYAVDQELARANQELREASLTDLLTAVKNRRFLTTIIDNDVRQVIRSYGNVDEHSSSGAQNRDLIFYLIDIDHFKMINDRFGHDQGDDLLVQIVARISSAIRHSDVLIRWGGEEFLVVSRYTNRDEAETLASRVLHAVGTEPFPLKNGRGIRRTCSVGWAAFPWFTIAPEAVDYREVLRLADRGLYDAKNAGRNRAIGLLSDPDPKAAARHYRVDGDSHPQLPTRTLITFGPDCGPDLDRVEDDVPAAAPSLLQS
jgi:diguanylate cyclase (GGDEF)-like protein